MPDERLGFVGPVRHAGNFTARTSAIEGVLLVSARRFGDGRGHFA